jgi:hypothetical protein
LDKDYKVSDMQNQYESQVALKRHYEYEIAKRESEIAQNKAHHSLKQISDENQHLSARAQALAEVQLSAQYQKPSMFLKQEMKKKMELEESIRQRNEVLALKRKNNDDQAMVETMQKINYESLRAKIKPKLDSAIATSADIAKQQMSLDIEKKKYQAASDNLIQLEKESDKMSYSNTLKQKEIDRLQESTSDEKRQTIVDQQAAIRKQELELETQAAYARQLNALETRNRERDVEVKARKEIDYKAIQDPFLPQLTEAMKDGITKDGELQELTQQEKDIQTLQASIHRLKLETNETTGKIDRTKLVIENLKAGDDARKKEREELTTQAIQSDLELDHLRKTHQANIERIKAEGELYKEQKLGQLSHSDRFLHSEILLMRQ